ncbi:MAG: Crp/Fnr family transcriptional regulator [Bacteroidia bacterium]|nr:Crp/Fnr family transcriptional regulator [Bacteroidia bacterium]
MENTYAEQILESYRKFVSAHAPLSDETWKLMKPIVSVGSCNKGERFIEEGKICQHVYYIFSGSARSYSNRDGDEITTGLYLEGVCVTNMKSLSTQSVSTINVQALEPMQFAKLSRNELMSLYDQSVELQAVGRAILETMIVEENELKDMYTLYDPEERYKFLLQKSPSLFQRVSLQYIASFMGIRRETLSRIRSKSARSGQ